MQLNPNGFEMSHRRLLRAGVPTRSTIAVVAFLLLYLAPITGMAADPNNEAQWFVKLVQTNNGRLFCAPTTKTWGEISKAFAEYIKSHQMPSNVTDQQAIQVLASIYPCSGGQNLAYEKGSQAFQSKDYASAHSIFKTAADAGDVRGTQALAALYANGLGVENRKALAILQSTQNLPPLLDRYKPRLLELQGLGTTYATVKLVQDAQPMAIAMTRSRAGLRDKESNAQCPGEKMRLIKTMISKPISAAEYLPLVEPGMEKTYLMRGAWEETWTYDVCGKEITTPIAFQADGLGGANYQVSGK